MKIRIDKRTNKDETVYTVDILVGESIGKRRETMKLSEAFRLARVWSKEYIQVELIELSKDVLDDAANILDDY